MGPRLLRNIAIRRTHRKLGPAEADNRYGLLLPSRGARSLVASKSDLFAPGKGASIVGRLFSPALAYHPLKPCAVTCGTFHDFVSLISNAPKVLRRKTR